MPTPRRRPAASEPAAPDLSYIAEQLRPLAVPVASLNLDPTNGQDHNEQSVQNIAASLRDFGQDQPLVVQTEGMIVRKGNGRLLAARALGWTHIAAVVITEERARAVLRGISDNRSAEFSPWNPQMLNQLLSELPMPEDNADLTAMLDQLREEFPVLEDDAAEPLHGDPPYEGEGPDDGGDLTEPPERRGASQGSISFTLVFDDDDQRDGWYAFLRALRDRMPDLETHGQRITKFLHDNEDRVGAAQGVGDDVP